jgi:hypothetical protein
MIPIESKGHTLAITEGRFCVFCGNTPDGKTREHVVPYWLLEMTGDPTRVVAFGQDFAKGKKAIRYSWSNYVAPACNRCNNKYSKLEDRIKPMVEALQRRETLSVADYVELLDWLDKVRIGVWFIRHMIENHPIQITPNFYIDARIAQKDRMIALYVFESENKGINLFGADSLIFSEMPSCFGLRINDILLINASSDFFCSAGCGFPYPATMKLQRGGDHDGKMTLGDFQYSVEIKHPITNLRLFKPVVWLYQPIAMPSTNPAFQGGFQGHFNLFDSWLAGLRLEGSDRQGAVFRQFSDRVEIHRSLSDRIDFDEVVGQDSAKQKDIAASVYDLQIVMFDSVRCEWQMPSRQRKFWKAYRKMQLKHTEQLARMYRAGAAALAGGTTMAIAGRK